MRLAIKFVKLSALVGLLGVCTWTIGCGESAPKKNDLVIPPSMTGSGAEAGSAKGAGVDVPMTDAAADPGAAKPEGDKPAADEKKPEGDKPAAEEKKDDAKTEGKKEESK